jgi:hypothetical protein
MEHTHVEIDENGAVFVPFNRVTAPSEGSACTLQLRAIVHETQVVFPTSGTKILRVLGRRFDRELAEVIEITHPITIDE